jgi:hypothetical protein
MLLLAVVAIAPGVSIFAGLLLFIPAIQMILGHAAPVFPQSIAARPLPTSGSRLWWSERFPRCRRSRRWSIRAGLSHTRRRSA